MNFVKKIIGPLISIIFIILIIKQVDLKDSIQYFKHIDLKYIFLIIPVYYLSYLLRAFRWRMILSNSGSLKIMSLISALFIGCVANCILPARMGEIYRAHIFGKKENLKRVKIFASIVIERILDGTVLFLILLSLVCLLFPKPWLFQLALLVGFIFIGSFIFFVLCAKHGDFIISKIFKQDFLNKLPVFLQKVINNHLRTFIEGLDSFSSFNLIVKSSLITLIIWLLESLVIILVIKSFGISINLLAALFIVSIIAFSTLIPAGPASIGPYQYGYIVALALFGINKENAFAISIVNQLLSICLLSLAGLFFIWKDHIRIKDLEDELQVQEE